MCTKKCTFSPFAYCFGMLFDADGTNSIPKQRVRLKIAFNLGEVMRQFAIGEADTHIFYLSHMHPTCAMYHLRGAYQHTHVRDARGIRIAIRMVSEE